MGSTGIVSVLFTDLVGSTEIATRLGEPRAEALRLTHFEVLREALRRSSGTEVKNLGDGLMVVFAAASEAVSTAVAMQQAIARHNQRAAEALSVRIGIAVGETTADENDYFGTPVVEAARLCAAADGGQVLVTEMVRVLAGSRAAHEFEAVGPLELKGLPAPVLVCAVRWEAVGTAGLPVPPRVAAAGGSPFVGRAAERELLSQAWKDAQQGHRRLVLVGGEPGMGKTRLAIEVALTCHREGATVLLGVCDEDLAAPYQPFVEALRHYNAVVPGEAVAQHLGRYANELVRLIPELAQQIPGLAASQTADADSERYLLFEAVARSLVAVAEDAPVVLVLDDLHWGTKPTLLMLHHLVRAAPQAALLVIVTYRDSDLTRDHPLAHLLADLRREDGVERVALRGLSDTDAVALVEGFAGRQANGPGVGLAQVVHAEAEGNPFFMREILRHLAETGAVVLTGDQWTFTGDVDALGLPDSVRDTISRRLGRLSGQTGSLLELASVVGRTFDVSVVAPLSGLSTSVVVGACDEGATAGLVRAVPDAPGRYRFAHALVRHTLYEGISAARRVELHRAVGVTLETLLGARRGDYATELAHHWLAALPALGAAPDDAAKAAAYAGLAGRQAMTSLAYEEAARYFQIALDAGGKGNVERLVDLGEAQRCAGDPSHRQTFLAAGRRALDEGDAELAARAALANQRGQFSRLGSLDPERVAALEAVLGVTGAANTPVRARLLASLAGELVYSDSQRCSDLAAEALALARRHDDPATVAHVLAATWFTHWDPGRLAERLGLAVELSELADRLGDRSLQFQGGMALYLSATQAADLETSDRGLAACVRLAGELGQPGLRWRATYAQASRMMLAGRLSEAERLAGEAMSDAELLGLSDGQVFYRSALSTIRRLQGRFEEAAAVFQPVFDTTADLAAVSASQADLLAKLGRQDAGRDILARFTANGELDVKRNYLWLSTLCRFVYASTELADRRLAAELYGLLHPYSAQLPASTATVMEPIAHGLGLLARTLGLLDEADEHFAAAEAIERRMDAPVFVAHTQLEWARLLLTRRAPGDIGRAHELLLAARAAATDLELNGVEAAADALLQEGDAPV